MKKSKRFKIKIKNKKTATIILLALVLLVSLLVVSRLYFTDIAAGKFGNWVYQDNNIYYFENGTMKTGWTKINGETYYFNNDGTLKKQMKMIDVSEFQNAIDWQAVKEDGIEIAMIRCSYGWIDYPSQIDKNFEYNYAEARRAGLKVGVYHYSYATTQEEALLEAEYVKKVLEGKELDFEVVYDIEDKVHENLSKNEYTKIANVFCDRIKFYGYEPMIYSSLTLLSQKLDTRSNKYDIWVAEYNTTSCSYENKYTAWQYTDKGLISGIDSYLDFNIRYF